jgi:hypothetical protein
MTGWAVVVGRVVEGSVVDTSVLVGRVVEGSVVEGKVVDGSVVEEALTAPPRCPRFLDGFSLLARFCRLVVIPYHFK